MKKESLGAIALRNSNGVPSDALAELFTQIIAMHGFINATGVPANKILEVYDEMTKVSRALLIELMEEDG